MSWRKEVKRMEKKAEKFEEKGYEKKAEKAKEIIHDVKKEHISYGLLFSAFIFLIGILMVIFGYKTNKDLFTVGGILIVLSIIIASFSGNKEKSRKD